MNRRHLGYTYREYRQAIEAEETLPQPVPATPTDWWAQRIPVAGSGPRYPPGPAANATGAAAPGAGTG